MRNNRRTIVEQSSDTTVSICSTSLDALSMLRVHSRNINLIKDYSECSGPKGVGAALLRRPPVIVHATTGTILTVIALTTSLLRLLLLLARWCACALVRLRAGVRLRADCYRLLQTATDLRHQ
jgi:hypothetical protein